MKSNVVLLAPVPEVHLQSGLLTCRENGKVAFASNDFQLFRKLDALSGDAEVDVYIYPSGCDLPGLPKVRWSGRYIGHVDSIFGRHPGGLKYRPASTLQSQSDNSGYWALFWEVADLRLMNKEEILPMSSFIGYEAKKPYVSTFIPHGPLIVYQAS
ncbi:MAG: hypothetical protein LBE54_05590 [Brucellaceae bacterium]|nr:hypothetical protein [Brucellaceae bacterium]